jgi:uncharacterized membrane protein
MDDLAVARVLHVLAVVLWIGGVGFVTTVAMPAIRASHPPAERLSAFHRFESRFVWQARLWVLLAGASGFWMIWRGDMWARFEDLRFWWMHAMLGVWLIFALMLFVIEPFVLQRRMHASAAPERDFDRMQAMHWVLLAVSLAATVGAVGGAHGLW